MENQTEKEEIILTDMKEEDLREILNYQTEIASCKEYKGKIKEE